MMIGVYGGTFNPVHTGHLIMAQEASNLLNLEKMIFVPAKHPPLKEINIASYHRYEMLKLAIAGNPKFEISDVEFRTQHQIFQI